MTDQDISTKVEIMATDIKYIKDELKEIKEYVKCVAETKADRTEVERLRANQDKVIWLVVSTVIIAVLGLVIKSSLNI